MIVYGTNAAHVKSDRSTVPTCPNCEENGSLVSSVFSKHAYLYWIPMFPIGMTGGTQCEKCGHTMEGAGMTPEVKEAFDDFKKGAKPKIWQFSGLAIIAALIIWFNISSSQDKKNELAVLADPMKGDVYDYKTDSGYSTMIVRARMGDSIYVSINEYETDQKSGVSEIDTKEYYSKDQFGVHKSRIEEMYEEGTIFGVNRY